jgi:MoaA/NifB/PqqE/SkfB family radical SAM enzyme
VRMFDRPGLRRQAATRVVDRFLPVRVVTSPDYIQVEVANRCNLRCIMCSITELSRARSAKYLSVDEFAAMAGQFPALKRVDLQGIGEPTLNPHLEGIVRWCREKGLEVGFVTNGLLMEHELARRLIEAGLTHIVFSMDSADSETFKRIRPGASLSKLQGNIRKFVEIRAELGLARPHVGIMAITMKDSIEGMAGVVEAAARLGVDALTIKGLNTGPAPDLEVAQLASHVERLRQTAAHYPRLAFTIACEPDHQTLHCRWPWTAAYVTAEGDVTPCCNCPDARVLSFGNLNVTPFASVWNSASYRRFRRELRGGVPEICRTCPDY